MRNCVADSHWGRKQGALIIFKWLGGKEPAITGGFRRCKKYKLMSLWWYKRNKRLRFGFNKKYKQCQCRNIAELKVSFTFLFLSKCFLTATAFLIRWYRSSGRSGARPLDFRILRILLPVTKRTWATPWESLRITPKTPQRKKNKPRAFIL